MTKPYRSSKIESRTPPLTQFMRQSETDPYLTLGPPAPERGWVYRDFRPMPLRHWQTLLAILGETEVIYVAANSEQLPPARLCRAQLWISPAAQLAWEHYLKPTQ